MHVMAAHASALGDSVKQNRCTATDTLPHLQALRSTADDLEPAFPSLRDDARFAKAAGNLRAVPATARAAPPLNCAGVGTSLQESGNAGKACHQDFRG